MSNVQVNTGLTLG